jgi:hypothetical protein
MTRFRILSAAAILSMKTATRVFAQAVIQGVYAFYLPNSDSGLRGAMVAVPFRNRRSHASSRHVTRNQGIER